MLIELVVRNLGVIAEARIPFGTGMTALTGETGAGKTMLVEALHLLSGGRADSSRVRPGATEAVVEALFEEGGTEWVLQRVVPAEGRARCQLNGELCTAATLAEVAGRLIEIHGQHSQQALLAARSQRDALDRFGAVDTSELRATRAELRRLAGELEALGGDDRARQRQIDLLEHQVREIEQAAPAEGEPEALAAEEDLLAAALAHREAGMTAAVRLRDDGAAVDLVAAAAAELSGRSPYTELAARLVSLQEELGDVASELASLAESIEPDEERLEQVRLRRHQLVELFRKYGDDPGQVLAFAAGAAEELEALRSTDQRRGELAARIADAEAAQAAAAAQVGAARRRAAPELGEQVAAVLGGLALGGATVEVDVADTADLPHAGGAVEFRLSTNPGVPPGPLSRVASGGELSRVMLALRLVLSGGPSTMVFDEVDAGVGGTAAVAVGNALAALAQQRQVLVVTHLAQVAAVADHQVVVEKVTGDAVTATEVRPVQGDARVEEVSRMLSGSPDSATAREHALELLGPRGAGATGAGGRRR